MEDRGLCAATSPELKESILEGFSKDSGSKQLISLRMVLKLTRFTRPLPSQGYISSKDGWEREPL